MQLTKTRVWILETVRNRSGLSLLCMKKILCFSVEPEQRKTLSRHGSVEIFDGAYNLTVPNKLARHSSTSKLEEIHSDHIKIVGEMEDNQQSEEVKETERRVEQPKDTINTTTGVTVINESSSQKSQNNEMSVSNESTCVNKTNVENSFTSSTTKENSFSSSTTSTQRSEMHQTLTSSQQTSYEETKQTNFQVTLSVSQLIQ